METTSLLSHSKGEDNLDCEAQTSSQNSSFIRPNTSFAIKIAVVIIFVIGSIILVVQNQSRGSVDTNLGSPSSTTAFKKVSSYSLSIQVSSPIYDTLESSSMHPWDAIAEPFREQRIEVTNFELSGQTVDLSTIEDSYHIIWTINGEAYTGNAVAFQIPDVGMYTSSVQLIPKDTSLGNQVYQKTFTIAGKYVRREIRSLSDDDRNKYFDALYTMYTVNEKDGQKLYGESYKPMEHFLYRHLKAAGTSDCDHWHDGAAILTNHIAITLEVEQVLQTIDPTISMPYWEFGMDTYLYEKWNESPIFNDDWFGEASPSTSNHQIGDASRWSTIEFPSSEKYVNSWSMKETGSLNPFTNSFGYLRSPWNYNPSPFIGRKNMTYNRSQYRSFPSCDSLRRCFQSDSLSQLHDCTNGETHGPVHILIGGAWGDEDKFLEVVDFMRRPQKLLFFKVLWRMGYTRCPSSCDSELTCRCSVPDEYINEYGAYTILKNANVIYPVMDFVMDYDESDEEFYLKLLRTVESPGIVGDMFSSASSFDPTFWPLHGASERLVNYRRIVAAKGEYDFDDTWGYPSYDRANGAAYLNGRCDWSAVDGPTDLTLPTCDPNDKCSGHAETDVMEFDNFKGNGEKYSNRDFFDFINPWNEDLPYVYDSYSYDYCADQGWDFAEFDDYIN